MYIDNIVNNNFKSNINSDNNFKDNKYIYVNFINYKNFNNRSNIDY